MKQRELEKPQLRARDLRVSEPSLKKKKRLRDGLCHPF